MDSPRLEASEDQRPNTLRIPPKPHRPNQTTPRISRSLESTPRTRPPRHRVYDGCRDLGPRQPRLLRGDQSEDTRDEIVSGRIDLHFGRDAVPRAPVFVGKTNP